MEEVDNRNDSDFAPDHQSDELSSSDEQGPLTLASKGKSNQLRKQLEHRCFFSILRAFWKR